MMVRRASRKETLKTHVAQMFVYFCLNIIGESVGFLKAAVIGFCFEFEIFLGGLVFVFWFFDFCFFAISFHS